MRKTRIKEIRMAMDTEDFEQQLTRATSLRKQLPTEIQMRQTLWRSEDGERGSERTT